MGSLSNTLEGTSGNAITTSNTAGPNQFNAVTTTGTGATVTFDNTHAHGGSTAAKLSLPSGVSATAFLDWSVLPNTPTANAYIRFYAYLTANPPANTVLCKFLDGTNVETTLQLQTTGIARTLNNAGGTISSLTESWPLNQWVRVEYEVTGISGTSGTVALRIFSGSNLETTSPDSGGSVSASSSSLFGTVTDVRAGTSSAVTETSAYAYWVDDVAYSDVATPGPSVTTPVPGRPLPVTAPRRAPARAVLRGTGAPFPAGGTVSGAAALAAAGSLTAAAVQQATAALTGAGSLSAGSTQAAAPKKPSPAIPRRRPARGWFAAGAGPGNSSIVSSGAVLAGTAGLSAVVTQGVTAALTGAGSLAAVVTQGSGASLTGAGTLTASAVQQATASLTAAGSLTAAAVQQATAGLTGAGSLSATSGAFTSGTAALAGAGTLTASGTVFAAGTASLTATGGLSAAVRLGATAQLAGTAALGTAAVQGAGAVLAAAGSLAATGAVPPPFTVGVLGASVSPQGTLSPTSASLGRLSVSTEP